MKNVDVFMGRNPSSAPVPALLCGIMAFSSRLGMMLEIIPRIPTPTMWWPHSIAKLVYNSNFTMVFVGAISIVNGLITNL